MSQGEPASGTSRVNGPDTAPVEVVCIGEALVQLSPCSGMRLESAQALELHTGGAEMNVAVALAGLGHHCLFVSRVGADPFGRRIVAELRRAGVRTRVPFSASRPTGVYFKDHEAGRTTMHYYRSGSAATRMELADLGDWADRPLRFHVSGVLAALGDRGYFLLDELLDRARKAGGRVSLDVNFRPGLWSRDEAALRLLNLARRADTVFVGLDEAADLWGVADADDVRRLLPTVHRCVVKDGGLEAASFDSDKVTRVPALGVPVLEPVGAGDAFAAGYLAGLLRATDARTRLRWGHVLAARALTMTGDQVDAPPSELLSRAAGVSDEDWAAGALLSHPYFRAGSSEAGTWRAAGSS